MLVFQGFQYGRVRGIAGLGLFLGRQAQLFKEDCAKLLGGKDVEFLPSQLVNAFLGPPDALAKGGAQILENLGIHAEALVLHIV